MSPLNDLPTMANGAPAQPRIEVLNDSYRVGYALEDVRVAFRRDVKISVGNISIDAKAGDMSSIPRWVAKILAGQDAVEVQSEDLAAYLLRAISRERIAKAHELSGVDADFYTRASDYLESLKERVKERERERERERESLVNSLNEFVDYRVSKIAKLAAVSPLTAELESRLSIEEREMYMSINRAVADFRKVVLKKIG